MREQYIIGTDGFWENVWLAEWQGEEKCGTENICVS